MYAGYFIEVERADEVATARLSSVALPSRPTGHIHTESVPIALELGHLTPFGFPFDEPSH